MKPGTIIRLPDGREGTVVYHGLDGYGIKWGRVSPDLEQILRGTGNLIKVEMSEDFNDYPDAMLRDPYKFAELECVGEDFEVVEEPEE